MVTELIIGYGEGITSEENCGFVGFGEGITSHDERPDL
ncbi:hypothetical protein CPT_Spivey_129 [Klebsiella phage Spivey]|uniref:Uncharacterized protein n=2 Tax=Sugarlandvirus sugarland TaxID=2560546 RepID=A0A2H4PH18_9CAUD|nr:hypothetical protein FDJ18_gp124 [Klebsiella phage Sugarland]ATW61948.1 hypothetical protein CPT_Sugarland_135 [Klebsiella phage Sugarland]QBX06935.1 hypothetical protein CPT_Spivey_077 [Klebsiella phage Spivey]